MASPMTICRDGGFVPSEPLYRRVPTTDETGQRLTDFMMLIPALRDRPSHLLDATLAQLDGVLRAHSDVVVYADLNLRLNVLWVSVRPRPGICSQLPVAIQEAVPEALLIGNRGMMRRR